MTSDPAPEGHSPSRFDLRVGDGRGEHELAVRLKVVSTDGCQLDEHDMNHRLRLLEILDEIGCLGLDRYAPGTPSATWEGADFEDHHRTGDEPSREWYEITGVYRLRDVSPDAVGLWVRSLAAEESGRIATLEVVSTQPDMVDRDWSAWLDDQPRVTSRPPVELPFVVTEGAARERLCVVTADTVEHDAVRGSIDMAVTVAMHLTRHELPDVWSTHSDGEHVLIPARGLPSKRPLAPELVALLRALVLTALAASHPGSVRAVEWSLGVDGPASAFDESAFTSDVGHRESHE